ncbi:probable catechol O-methyltransferase 2 [Aspergillus udagawae]|uniref:catechol O-methyltransferase n=1 Tax=Aspergillus udagawae TaxID=91492 RepID=A0A8H3N364_9EURO|nr:probable catechol O-methyltransferase 2 [Aspergillus udagawae]GFF80680.1 probable catechol O-methyltransferase 2 [Aspergillus udagawae]GFG05252.1 probable catechol O-methyltransferase 2 [Aspergillus udagawae]
MGAAPAFYKPEGEVFYNDGREDALLKFITTHPRHAEIKGSPEAMLAAIDEFGHTQDFLMTVGEYKGKIVRDLIVKEKPQTVLEIGGYVGYSAIMFGDALRKAGGQKYVSLEMNAKFASIARALVDIAGLGGFVEIVEGVCRESLRKIAGNRKGSKAWDMVFLDHSKISYLNDLKLCEELGIVAPGSIVVADDMYLPGNPQYTEYVRAPVQSKVEARKPFVGCVSDGGLSLGNPYLVYESTIFEGLQPSGLPDAVEVSYCVDTVGPD